MALACIAIILGLAHLLTAKPLDCEPLVPETIDNATMTKLLGMWFYIAAASQHLRTLQELELIKSAYYFLYPSSHQDTFPVTQVMRLKDKCVVDNTSYISVIRDNSTMILHGPNESSVAQLIKSSEDTLMLYHLDGTDKGLSISARAQNLSTEQLEEFKTQVACLGLKEEETFYTSVKDLCPMEEERDDKKHSVEVVEPPLG
ncbi:RCC1 and BTB domain-containing protein 1 [Platysternon megacephalum]|uniref:RCC1 and BTB domain-containing protein 1 n=1 Tax=Platysternon megacephalum TaxID=55544 RepID=A0A4D9EQD9_9SAUR|nr:RCC1 and BTB domain-containing protein 1 [Platysternon megacephalum]